LVTIVKVIVVTIGTLVTLVAMVKVIVVTIGTLVILVTMVKVIVVTIGTLVTLVTMVKVKAMVKSNHSNHRYIGNLGNEVHHDNSKSHGKK
jgi:hypothetical protein